jgi:hypothetical protein
MATKSQVGGMLLEEVVLFLLEGSGYRTVTSSINDPTLTTERGSLCVKGRGATHQIDAIADYRFPPPFGQPHRLLVEAKLLDKPVGIGIVRNALGVHRDVSEYWVSRQGHNRGHRPRHHYQYAIFSATSFSSYAQNYAFAHDIFLLTLNDSPFLQPVVAAVDGVAEQIADQINEDATLSLGDVRNAVRLRLDGRINFDDTLLDLEMNHFLETCAEIRFGLLGMLQGRLPILLVPHPGIHPENLNLVEDVRIFWDDHGWYIRRRNGTDLFSFSLPKRLFELYADEGTLGPIQALNLKGEMMRSITAFQYLQGGESRIIELRLDEMWLNDVLARLHDAT